MTEDPMEEVYIKEYYLKVDKVLEYAPLNSNEDGYDSCSGVNFILEIDSGLFEGAYVIPKCSLKEVEKLLVILASQSTYEEMDLEIEEISFNDNPNIGYSREILYGQFVLKRNDDQRTQTTKFQIKCMNRL